LDALHLRKIDLADRVLIIDPCGYVGESTRREIDYPKPLASGHIRRPSLRGDGASRQKRTHEPEFATQRGAAATYCSRQALAVMTKRPRSERRG
jgi:hypothetical protein